jgi:hypothetical protein
MAYDPGDFKWLGDDNYVKMPRKMIFDTTITDRQRRLWAVLQDKGGDNRRVAWPTHKWLAAQLGSDDKGQIVSKRMVLSDLAALERAGWLEIVPWIGWDGEQSSNNYIMWPARAAMFAEDEFRTLRVWGGYPEAYRATHPDRFLVSC